MKRLAAIGLLIFLISTLAAASGAHVTVRGTVVTGVVTTGGDCTKYKYWLEAESPVLEKKRVALEPESKILIQHVNKKVEIEGDAEPCPGTTTQFVVLHIKHLTPLAGDKEKNGKEKAMTAGAEAEGDRKPKCGDWKATLNLTPPHPPRALLITGKCHLSAAGSTARLKRHNPQGINPAIYLMDLEIKPKPGTYGPNVVAVEYKEKKAKEKYTTIHIIQEGTDIPVEIIQ